MKKIDVLTCIFFKNIFLIHPFTTHKNVKSLHQLRRYMIYDICIQTQRENVWIIKLETLRPLGLNQDLN